MDLVEEVLSVGDQWLEAGRPGTMAERGMRLPPKRAQKLTNWSTFPDATSELNNCSTCPLPHGDALADCLLSRFRSGRGASSLSYTMERELESSGPLVESSEPIKDNLIAQARFVRGEEVR